MCPVIVYSDVYRVTQIEQLFSFYLDLAAQPLGTIWKQNIKITFKLLHRSQKVWIFPHLKITEVELL